MVKSTNISSTITVIGPRSSGKTTFLAGLAYFPQRKQQEGKQAKFKVIAGSDNNSQKLLKNAKRLILERSSFNPSKENNTYSFTIEIFSRGNEEKIFLQAIDFPGEGLDFIGDPSSKYREYLEERLTAKFNNFLILLADWEPPESDFTLSETIDIFKKIVREKANAEDLKELKLAVVMNKCERGELWPSRLTPKMDIFEQYLPDTIFELRSFLEEFGIPPENLEFFAMSTFGVLDYDDPRPNRKDQLKKSRTATQKGEWDSVLRSPNKWNPYGMLSPIYWLATSKRLPNGV